jgi:hypothetical protein
MDPAQYSREVWIVVQTEMQYAPFLFDDEPPAKSRLAKAAELVIGGKVTATPGGELYQVQGSTQTYTVNDQCTKDDDTWEMLGRPAGLLCYVCTLTTRSGEVLGEGRGARDIQKDKGDINKAIKMAQKSAQCDAILRTGALSDLFTQDIGEEGDTAGPQGESENADHYKRQIMALLTALQVPRGDKAHYEAAVLPLTGVALAPENYVVIISKLKARLGPQAA